MINITIAFNAINQSKKTDEIFLLLTKKFRILFYVFDCRLAHSMHRHCQDPRKHLRWRALYARLSILDVYGPTGYTLVMTCWSFLHLIKNAQIWQLNVFEKCCPMFFNVEQKQYHHCDDSWLTLNEFPIFFWNLYYQLSSCFCAPFKWI